MPNLRTTLQQLLAEGPSGKQQIDRLLCAHQADPREDMRTTLDQVNLDQLLLLQQKFREGRVVGRSYRRDDAAGQAKGCLLYWLLGFCSNQDLIAYRFPSDEVFKAVVRTIRFWDSGDLTREVVLDVLQAAVQERQAPFLKADPISLPQRSRKPTGSYVAT